MQAHTLEICNGDCNVLCIPDGTQNSETLVEWIRTHLNLCTMWHKTSKNAAGDQWLCTAYKRDFFLSSSENASELFINLVLYPIFKTCHTQPVYNITLHNSNIVKVFEWWCFEEPQYIFLPESVLANGKCPNKTIQIITTILSFAF